MFRVSFVDDERTAKFAECDFTVCRSHLPQMECYR